MAWFRCKKCRTLFFWKPPWAYIQATGLFRRMVEIGTLDKEALIDEYAVKPYPGYLHPQCIYCGSKTDWVMKAVGRKIMEVFLTPEGLRLTRSVLPFFRTRYEAL